MQSHRIHVVHHILDDQHESWCSKDGDVVLMRPRGQRHWKAVVDAVVVTDAERLNGPLAYEARPGEEPDATMLDPSPEGLAHRLAMQEHVHVVFERGD